MSKFQSTVKSRLYRKGYQGFTKADFISCADVIGVKNLEEPTADELDKATQYMIDSMNKLTLSEDFSPVIQSSSLTEIQPDFTEESPETTTLTVAKKQELVTTQADSMGIELSQDDALKIATDVDENSIDITESLEELKGLILAYVAVKKAKMQQVQQEFRNDINTATEDFYQTVNHETQLTNQTLAQIATTQRQRTTAIKQDYKKKLDFFREALKLS